MSLRTVRLTLLGLLYIWGWTMDGKLGLRIVVKGDDPLVEFATWLRDSLDPFIGLVRICCVQLQLFESGLGDIVFIEAFESIDESSWRNHHFLCVSPSCLSSFQDADYITQLADTCWRVGIRAERCHGYHLDAVDGLIELLLHFMQLLDSRLGCLFHLVLLLIKIWLRLEYI